MKAYLEIVELAATDIVTTSGGDCAAECGDPMGEGFE